MEEEDLRERRILKEDELCLNKTFDGGGSLLDDNLRSMITLGENSEKRQP